MLPSSPYSSFSYEPATILNEVGSLEAEVVFAVDDFWDRGAEMASLAFLKTILFDLPMDGNGNV